MKFFETPATDYTMFSLDNLLKNLRYNRGIKRRIGTFLSNKNGFSFLNLAFTKLIKTFCKYTYYIYEFINENTQKSRQKMLHKI